jgi:hypothetical protein
MVLAMIDVGGRITAPSYSAVGDPIWHCPQLVYAVANSQKIMNHLMIKSIT